MSETDPIKILVEMHKHMDTKIDKIQDSIMKTNGISIANGKHLKRVSCYIAECSHRVTQVELWKAGHMGEEKGSSGKESKTINRITFVTVLIAIVISAGGFVYSFKPKPINQEVLKKMVKELVLEKLVTKN